MPKSRRHNDTQSVVAVLVLVVLVLIVRCWWVANVAYSPVAPRRPLSRGVTYVTHMSWARRRNLERILQVWRADDGPGPVVVVFFASSFNDTEAIVRYIDDELHRPQQLVYTIYSNPSDDLRLYPINVLRNIGLGHVKTELCVLADGDMIPNKKLYEDVISSKYPSFVADVQHTAFVLPIFHLAQSEETGQIPPVPGEKSALLSALDRGEVKVTLDHPRRPHHFLTDYNRWKSDTRDYNIRYRFWYEPYLLMSPRYMPFF
uniref:Hexosyltransferase n=1 Tax=Eutreptiella gymnastica TaxID=73025 RepID=A0A7S4GPG5_9EUGL